MRIQSVRTRVKILALAACGVAVLGSAAGTALASSRPPHAASRATVSATVPVVVNCQMHTQVKPGEYLLACADGNSYLAGLHWAAWGTSAAFASGSSVFNDCIPYCADGHFHSFPALVALWRPEPLPGQPGVRYFSELTIIYTGNRSYRAGGHLYHVPQTQTIPLSADGGA